MGTLSVYFGVTTQIDSRCTLNSQRKVGRAFLPDPETLEGQPGMADLPRLPEQLRFGNTGAIPVPRLGKHGGRLRGEGQAGAAGVPGLVGGWQ
jgi:hypothetical protein